MPIKGTLKEGELRIAQMQFDFLKQPMHVQVLAAIVDPKIGDTRAYIPATGVVWSKETSTALAGLVACIERDIANVMMSSGAAGSAEERGGAPTGGIGEHLSGSTPDAPQM